MSNIRIHHLPSTDTQYDAEIVDLLNSYAQIEIIHGKSLPDAVLARMLPGLREHGGLIFLAFDDASSEQKPIGVLTAARGYSTFYAQPLLNAHDLAVAAEHRGKGVGSKLLQALEEHARESGCCKVTLEVLAENARAHALYNRLGFDRAIDGSPLPATYFLQKPLL